MPEPTMPAGGWPGDLALVWAAALVPLLAAALYVRWARRRTGRLRLLLGNVLVTVALVATLAAATETWLRFGYDSTTWHARNFVTRAWFLRHWQLNDQGFRDAEWAGRAALGGPRVAVVGDSFTAGYGIANPADRFADQLATKLGPQADVRVIASIGSDTRRQLEQLRAMFAVWRPTRVVLAYSPNDAEFLLDDAIRDGPPLAPPAAGTLASRSFVLDLVRSEWAVSRSGAAERYFTDLEALHHDPARWGRQAQLFGVVAELVRSHGAQLDVAVFPLLSHWGDDYPFDEAHAMILRTWSGVRAGTLDLRETFANRSRGDLVVSRFDAHPNESAHRAVADAIFDAFFEKHP